jgi:hypothetical protein
MPGNHGYLYLCFLVVAANCTLLPLVVHAEGIDTEHLWAFLIGTDVGEVGEREFESQLTGRFTKSSGTYQALTESAELEFVPIDKLRLGFGAVGASYNISSVPGFEDIRQTGLQGVVFDWRYKFLDRKTAGFGLTFDMETHADRLDEISGQHVRNYGTDLTLAFDRELIADRLMFGVNLLYQPEWTNLTSTTEQDVTLGIAWSLIAQVQPNLFIGGEARYLRKYNGMALDALAGQALFVGPTLHWHLTERSRITAAWSFQVAGQSATAAGPLDLNNFEHHQARFIYSVDF